jgi:hypothetical protein
MKKKNMSFSFTSILLCCIVIFLYIHLKYHRRRIHLFEILQVEQPLSSTLISDVCNTRQPALFTHPLNSFNHVGTANWLYANNTPDIRIQDVLVNTNELDKYFTQNTSIIYSENIDVLENANLNDFLEKTCNSLLAPVYHVKFLATITMGAIHIATKVTQHNYARSFLIVTSGKVEVRLAPPKTLIEKEQDWESKRFLYTTLHTGTLLSIPLGWWYSIRLIEPGSTMFTLSFDSIIGTINRLPEIAYTWLQELNTTYVKYHTIKP